jgi:hypothetical protein
LACTSIGLVRKTKCSTWNIQTKGKVIDEILEEDKAMSVGEIANELKALLGEMTEMLRNLESEEGEGAIYMLDDALYEMKNAIGEKYGYGGGTGWIYELYKLQRQ